MKLFLVTLILLVGTFTAEARRRKTGAAAAHAEVGMKRANADDLDGAIEAFRAQLKYDQHKANAHNNLGVTLLRMGNSRDAETARRLYHQALTNFQSSLQQG